MKRAEQLAKTRQAILKTATTLFLQKGFSGASTRDIAKQIGITQPALYHHFNDKEVLYLAVLTNLCGRVRQDINKVMRKQQSASIQQRHYQDATDEGDTNLYKGKAFPSVITGV